MTDEDLNKIRKLVKEEINDAIDPIKEKLDHPERGIDALNDKMDILMGEMIEIRKLTKATNELVRVNREVIEEKITDIKKHIGLSS